MGKELKFETLKTEEPQIQSKIKKESRITDNLKESKPEEELSIITKNMTKINLRMLSGKIQILFRTISKDDSKK